MGRRRQVRVSVVQDSSLQAGEHAKRAGMREDDGPPVHLRRRNIRGLGLRGRICWRGGEAGTGTGTGKAGFGLEFVIKHQGWLTSPMVRRAGGGK